jgi:hypothetical protein
MHSLKRQIAFDAEPMYDTSDEATNRSQASKAEAVLGFAPSTALWFHHRKEMADRPIFG